MVNDSVMLNSAECRLREA